MTRKREIVLLLLIAVVGLCLRLSGLYLAGGYHPGAIGDELDGYRVALEFMSGQGQAAYIGQPNFPRNGTAHLPGPLWAVLWSVPLRFGGGPESMIALIAVLNSLVIFLVHNLAAKIAGRPYALWAALLYATLPWPVYSSVGCWNPQVMALLGTLVYLALWATVTRPGSRCVFWVVVVLGMMPHFHMFGAFLVPSVVILLASRWKQVNKKWAAAGLVVSLAFYVPYFLGELPHHWDNTRRMFGVAEPFTFGCLKCVTLPIVALSSLMYSTLETNFRSYMEFGRAVFGSFAVLGFFNSLSLVLGLLAIASFLVALSHAMRGFWLSPRRAFDASTGRLFLGVLLFLPLVLFLGTGHNFNGRYLFALHPLLAVVAAMYVVDCPARWRPLVRGCTVLTIGFNVILIPTLFRYQEREGAQADCFVPAFRRMEAVREILKADAGSKTPIRIDTAAFPRSGGTKLASGARTLARYVDVRERFDPSVDQSGPVQVYRVEASANLMMDRQDRVVYQGSGIVVFRLGLVVSHRG